ncbi:MAG TPA: GxxExxY protein [Planctomycetota bacterium]
MERDPLTDRIIASAIEIHRVLGPGLLESAYESALCVEFVTRGHRHARQVVVPMTYRGQSIGEYRLDLLVEDRVVVEITAVDKLIPVYQAQVLTYLRATGKRIGPLINFNTALVSRGIQRFIV